MRRQDEASRWYFGYTRSEYVYGSESPGSFRSSESSGEPAAEMLSSSAWSSPLRPNQSSHPLPPPRARRASLRGAVLTATATTSPTHAAATATNAFSCATSPKTRAFSVSRSKSTKPRAPAARTSAPPSRAHTRRGGPRGRTYSLGSATRRVRGNARRVSRPSDAPVLCGRPCVSSPASTKNPSAHVNKRDAALSPSPRSAARAAAGVANS